MSFASGKELQEWTERVETHVIEHADSYWSNYKYKKYIFNLSYLEKYLL